MILFVLSLLACGTPTSDTAECPSEGTSTLTFAPVLPSLGLATKPELEVYDAAGEAVATLGDGDSVDLPAGLYYAGFGVAVEVDDGSGFRRMWGLPHETVQVFCLGADVPFTLDPTYEEQPAGRHLWFSAGEALAALTPEALATSGDVVPDLRMDVATTNDFRGFAFDRFGDLWAATSDTYGVRLLVFAPDQVEAGGAVEPMLSLTNAAFENHADLKDIAFSPAGDLVAAESGSSSSEVALLGFGPGSRAVAIGAGLAELDPAWTATVPGMITPFDLAFDGAGDLWVTDQGQPALLRLDAAALRDGEVTPAATLTVAMGEVVLRGPTDLAFTPDGDLLVDYWTDGTLVRLAAADLAATGSATVAPAESWSTDVLSLPYGLAVTGNGVAWYGNEPSQLASIDGIVLGLGALPTPVDVAVVGGF